MLSYKLVSQTWYTMCVYGSYEIYRLPSLLAFLPSVEATLRMTLLICILSKSQPATVSSNLTPYLPLVVAIGGEPIGTLDVGGVSLKIDGGSAYVEKDWGSKFPKTHVWVQAELRGNDVLIHFPSSTVIT